NSINKIIDQIDNKAKLDESLSLFIAWLTKIDDKLFKVESFNNCYAALACYLCENSSIPSNIDSLNPKILKLFEIPMNDPEKIKLYKYRPRMPLKKATNNIILQHPK
ncbi:28482_t:CDS:1, partial [Racocetra persica]